MPGNVDNFGFVPEMGVYYRFDRSSVYPKHRLNGKILQCVKVSSVNGKLKSARFRIVGTKNFVTLDRWDIFWGIHRLQRTS